MSHVFGGVWTAGVVALIVLHWYWYARTPECERPGRGRDAAGSRPGTSGSTSG
ncbi:hypothetical protein [Nakamurella leprariae]|uniref:Uncharacterized protein n=1 Tax=Nakamurella leprariae TaxID=2803911 RepID=A0A938YCV2_9ACTN|nr:hypothetical protein [Nakamurella leprariae]MBM9465854.1 hypothetical protein [Nakamurella leprariae]